MSRTAPSNARMNSRPMILRLPSGLVTPDNASEKPVGDVDGDQVGAGGGDEVTLHLGPLAGPQQPVVDEHARQPVADGALHQCGGHRGVHAAGQPADRPAVTDLAAHLFDERIGDVRRRPRRVDPGELVQEPAQYLLPVRGVQHLGVILHTRQPAGPVLERRNGRAGTRGHHLESVRSGGDGVTVAHPHRLGCGQIGMELSPSHFQLGAAVLTGSGLGDGAAQAPGPSPESRSRCRTPAPRGRTVRGPAAARRLRTRWPDRRTARWLAGLCP